MYGSLLKYRSLGTVQLFKAFMYISEDSRYLSLHGLQHHFIIQKLIAKRGLNSIEWQRPRRFESQSFIINLVT